jgi:DNA (cytosine-5)-methyltransferase 1
VKIQNVLDLCSGGGGFLLAEAIASPQFCTVALCDNNKDCQEALALRFPGIPIIQNITNVTAITLRRLGIPQIDGICGGFPCQPHSVSGKKKGKEDDRDLWPEFQRILCDLRPQWAIFENVPGLFTTDSGRFFRGVLGDLAELGFDAEWGVVPCAYVDTGDDEFVGVGGVHLRERVWIVAYANSLGCGNGASVQRKYKDLLHEEWLASQSEQSGSGWLGGVEQVCSPDADADREGLEGGEFRTSRQETLGDIERSRSIFGREQLPQSLLCRSHDGLPTDLGGYLLRHEDLDEWLTASTVPSFRRAMRTSLELTPEEVRALSPEDRKEYQQLKRTFDKEFSRAAKNLEGKSANKYCQLKDEFEQTYKEYQEVKQQMNSQLSIYGNAIVPQVGAIAFQVLEEHLARNSVVEKSCK